MDYQELKEYMVELEKLIGGEGRVFEAFDMIISLLQKAAKYRWHDLREGSKDLPEDGKEVLVVAKEECGDLDYGIAEYADGWGWISGDIDEGYMRDEEIICWRYFEPFKEETDNGKIKDQRTCI